MHQPVFSNKLWFINHWGWPPRSFQTHRGRMQLIAKVTTLWKQIRIFKRYLPTPSILINVLGMLLQLSQQHQHQQHLSQLLQLSPKQQSQHQLYKHCATLPTLKPGLVPRISNAPQTEEHAMRFNAPKKIPPTLCTLKILTRMTIPARANAKELCGHVVAAIL